MLILPVLDLLGGVVVRGVGGRRSEYRPIVSTLTRATDPLSIARAFRDHFGLTTLYLADLDAIAGKPPAFPVYTILSEDGFRLFVDAGLRAASSAVPLRDCGVDTILAGLETIPGPDTLLDIADLIGPENVIVSLDMKENRVLTPYAPWHGADSAGIAREIVALGFWRLLLLDLARVGMNQGTGTDEIAASLQGRFGATVELFVGGGVRGPGDVQRFGRMGLAGLLVGSALHDGKLTRDDL
ncbi:MAG: HisA/HisF-related TIM barrel protein [Gemmataceae bacterium]